MRVGIVTDVECAFATGNDADNAAAVTGWTVLSDDCFVSRQRQ